MSTYSPNLRIELITNGTQAGGWGTTTNTNLGTLIEAAISGYNTITITSVEQALTTSDGGPDEARQAILRLYAADEAFEVYIPPSPKQYTFFNDTLYTATIYCSTVIGNTTIAGAGVAIPPAATMTVWSNGISVRQQNTHLISPTLASPVMTGVPLAPTAVAGTSTTQVATTEFVAAALGGGAQALFPVGSIYINATNSANPNSLFGFGTWVAFGAGRVPVGFDSTNDLFNTAQETGGYADSIVVSHTHTATTTFTGGAHTHTGSTSSGGSHQHFIASNISSSGDDITATEYTAREKSDGGERNYRFVGDTTPATVGLTSSSTVGPLSFTTNSATVSGSGSTTISTEGVTGVNKNYQPYITVYMWRRTA